MSSKKNHNVRSCYSYHNKPDYSGFERKANLKSANKKQSSLIEKFFGIFKRQKKGDK